MELISKTLKILSLIDDEDEIIKSFITIVGKDAASDLSDKLMNLALKLSFEI